MCIYMYVCMYMMIDIVYICMCVGSLYADIYVQGGAFKCEP